MTRAEYLHLLRTAKALDDMRAYLLVKLFVTTDLPIHSLPKMCIRDRDLMVQAPLQCRRNSATISQVKYDTVFWYLLIIKLCCNLLLFLQKLLRKQICTEPF